MQCPRCGWKLTANDWECPACAAKEWAAGIWRSDGCTRAFNSCALFIVIFVVLLIIFPKLVGSTRGAKEDGLRGSLQQMRMAIMCFKSDTGHYPIILDDLVALSPADVKTKIKPGTYKGPYLFTEGGIGGDGPPRNPFISGRDTVVAHHWKYNAKTGTVTVPDSMAARTRRSDNKRYDQL